MKLSEINIETNTRREFQVLNDKRIRIKDKKLSLVKSTSNLLKEIFLPQGYPHTVTPDYFYYQLYDTLQAFCSTITSLLANQSSLAVLGVGDGTASTSSALLLWIVKEGVEKVSRIVFAWQISTHLDKNAKTWRFAADWFNDVGSLLEFTSPLFAKSTFIVCASTLFKGLCGVAAGSTKASLTVCKK